MYIILSLSPSKVIFIILSEIIIQGMGREEGGGGNRITQHSLLFFLYDPELFNLEFHL